MVSVPSSGDYQFLPWSALLGKEVPAFHEGDRSSEMMKVLRSGKVKAEVKTGMKAGRVDEFTDQ